MCQVRDIVNTADNTPTVAAEVKETLGLLMSLAEAKGNAYEEKIKGDLKSGKMGDDLTVSITKVIKSHTEYRAVTKSGTTKIIDDIKDSLGNLFSGDGKILDGISGIINTALTAVMGAGEGQESEVTSYSVVAEYPAIVRFDFAFWGRNIRAQSIKDYMENVFTCVAYKSAVDVSKLAFNDFLALYGPILRAAYGDDQTKLKEMIEQAKDIYSLFKVQVKELPSDVTVKALVQEASSKPLFNITTQPATKGNF
ncbi:MAG: hypothetical protein ACUBOA_04420 [Candidatus Loosdrechtia sp.]|uniref:hypothetical protein n=1 Tax=Candidatus Loosdrechtia sp. TaxID=3101272 RepID=UPI003A6D2E71|nr:MAG: hypothetical protein QY305_08150 [Candidatus Jettenia sp. AMX2]